MGRVIPEADAWKGDLAAKADTKPITVDNIDATDEEKLKEDTDMDRLAMVVELIKIIILYVYFSFLNLIFQQLKNL